MRRRTQPSTRWKRAGHPVVRIASPTSIDIGQEFFRWEIATAVAGAIIGINPFDQPDVEASKVATRELTSALREERRAAAETPIFAGERHQPVHRREERAAWRRRSAAIDRWPGICAAHLNRLEPGDYFALLAYVGDERAARGGAAGDASAVRDRTRVATCLGFGPRFLHSTGQAYKGGPNSGVFLQITCDDAVDLPVPGQKYSFGVVKAAEARGDFAVLVERERRALRVHLGADVARRIAPLLRAAVARALEERNMTDSPATRDS